MRTGIQWRDLPERFGRWNSVFKRFNLWSKKGVLQKWFQSISSDNDPEWLFIDGSIVKAHQDSSGAASSSDEAIGGCTPESQKFPSAQLQSRHERIQVDELAVSLEGVMPVQQDVPPGRWRHLRDQRQRLGIASCLVLRQQQGQDRRVVEDDRVADQPGALVADLDFDVGAAGQFLLPTDLGDGRA